MNLTSIMERDLLIEAGRMFVIAKSGIFLSRHDRPDGRNNKTNRTGGGGGGGGTSWTPSLSSLCYGLPASCVNKQDIDHDQHCVKTPCVWRWRGGQWRGGDPVKV